MKAYPKIESVKALRSKTLKVVFKSGDIRFYDCRPLLKEEPFTALQNEALFSAVKAEEHGYAVVWNDEIDLSESEIWIHGRTELGSRGALAPSPHATGPHRAVPEG